MATIWLHRDWLRLQSSIPTTESEFYATQHHQRRRAPTVASPPLCWTPVKVSTRGDYASRALLSLALAGEQKPTSVRDIAERTALPQPYLEQILLALKGAGLVRSKRGVGGGYVLAREPAEITLADIVSAVDGPIVAGDFGEPHSDGACDHQGQCVLLAIWSSAGDLMRSYLEACTLADVAEMAAGNRAWPGEAPSS